MEFVASHFEVSKKEADEYVNLFKLTDSGMTELRELCAKYGKDQKEVDKLCS